MYFLGVVHLIGPCNINLGGQELCIAGPKTDQEIDDIITTFQLSPNDTYLLTLGVVSLLNSISVNKY